jgi:Co/Zn/Cd efflux system component
MNDRLRRAVLIVALLNLGYFGVEFAVATTIASVSLFADYRSRIGDGLHLAIRVARSSRRAWHFCYES